MGPGSKETTTSSIRPGWLGGMLFVVVLAVLSPTLRNGFVSYDDNEYVVKNGQVLGGLTGEGIAWAFRTTHMGNWHPLTWLSHQLDVEIYGAKPKGHHFSSLGLHAINAVLVFMVFLKMTRAVWRSLLVAALFGLHPLHVESVAWIAERKDVLSAFWWLLSLWAYVHWCQAKAANAAHPARWYGLALLCFAAGLMSKPMVVTLPCVLLLFDYWPLRRWGLSSATGMQLAGFWTRLVEKIPFLVLSAVSSVITVVAQTNAGAVSSLERLPWESRVLNATTSYFGYLRKCFSPVDLAAIYPLPEKLSVQPAIIAGMLLVVITVAVLRWWRTRPYLIVGWFIYLGMLVPVIGLVQVGNQAMADRYTYLPLLGIFMALVWGMADWSVGWNPRSRQALGWVTALMLALLAALSVRQVAHWRNAEALALRALAVTEKNWNAHMILGYTYEQEPARLAEAIDHYRAACRLAPTHAEARFALVSVLARKPSTQAEAMAEAQIALTLKPGNAWGHFVLGKALRDLSGKHAEAVESLAEAVRAAPANGDYRFELAATLALLPARALEAEAAYRDAIRLKPEQVELRNNLGLVLARIPGRLSEAIAEYQFVIQARPDFADAHNNLANALRKIPGRELEAITAYETALHLQPAHPEVEYNLGALLAALPGREPEAVAHFEAILRRRPDWQPAVEMMRYLQGRRNAVAP